MRNILFAAAIGTMTAGAAAAQETFEMTSAFGKNLPILGTAGVDFVEKINSISTEVEFEHYDPGELVPTLEALDAVSNGSVDAAFTTSGYWQGKITAASLFAAVPFGPEAGEFLGWMLYDDGHALMQRMYDENGYNVHVEPCGVIAPETSGWFKEEITSLDDLQGLNMRFFGLGAEVMQKLGVSTSLLAGGDIFPALERGAIDATEWVGAYNDVALGLHEAARYYYYPGWQEPGPGLEAVINREAWEALPADLQAIVETACQSITTDMVAEYTHGNAYALQQLLDDPDVEIRHFPKDVLDLFESITREVVAEMSASDPLAKRIEESYYGFLEKSREAMRVSEQAYLNTRG